MNKDQASSGRCPTCGQGLDEGSFGGVCPACAFGRILGEPEVIEGGEKRPNAGREGVAEVAGALRPGDRIGAYKILEEIGEGGCGKVYVAEQEQPVRRRVALKVIKLGMDTREVIGRFEAERQALAMMDHPNIAKVLDAGSTDAGRPFFVMELVKGIRITDYCDRNSVSTEERLRLFIQVCQAIQHAHQKGIIHRDIKPANILITLHDGVAVPKVIDFGIAKATSNQRLTDKTVYTAMLQFVGTPAYMSPEQAELSGLDIDTRSDIYALGVLLYELLTGCTPFDTRRLALAGIDEVRRIIREEEPPRPSTKISTLAAGEQQLVAKRRQSELPRLLGIVRGDLDWIVMKALEKDRQRRYDTAAGFASDIQRYLRDEPVVARPPSRIYRFQKTWRRNKGAILGGAVVVAALVVGLTISIWKTRVATFQAARATAAEREQRVLRDRAEAERTRAESETLKANRLLDSLDLEKASALLQQGRYSEPLAHLARLLRRSPANQVATAMVFHSINSVGLHRQISSFQCPEKINRKSTSPDGRWFLTVSTNGAAKVWDISNGKSISEPIHQTGAIVWASFSPNSRWFITASKDGTARVWETATGRPVGEPLRHNGVRYARFSPDGRWVVTASDDRTARTWEALTGKPVGIPMQHEEEVLWVEFSGDGRWVLTKAKDRTVRVWDSANGKPAGPALRHENDIFNAELSSDGRLVFTTEGGWAGKVWDSASGKILVEGFRHAKRIESGEFSPDGRSVVTASEDRTARIWEAATGRPLSGPFRHGDDVTSASFSPDGRWIVTASDDDTVRIWEASSGRPMSEPLRHGSYGMWARFSPDGRWIVADNYRGVAMVWDAVGRSPKSVLVPHLRDRQISPGLSRDGRWIVTVPDYYTAKVSELATGRSVGKPLGHESGVSQVEMSPNGRTVLTISDDGAARIWEVATGKLITAPLRHDTSIRTGKFSPDGQWIITIAEDGNARLWSSVTGELAREPVPHGNQFLDLNFNPDGRLIVMTLSDRTARIYDVNTGNPVGQALRHEDRVLTPEFSPDGKWLSTLSRDDVVTVWDVASGRQACEPLRHGDTINNVEWSQDSRFLVTTGTDRIARIWNRESGMPSGDPLRHEDNVNDASFSPDGRWVVTASDDRVARIWDVISGRLVNENLWNTNEVYWVRFTPDGKRIAAASNDGTVEIMTHSGVDLGGSWLADLAEVAGGLRLNESGDYMRASNNIAAINLELDSKTSKDPLSAWARWLTSNDETRTFNPWSNETIGEFVDRVLKDGNLELILQGEELQPTNGLLYAEHARRLLESSEDESTLASADALIRHALRLSPVHGSIYAAKAQILYAKGDRTNVWELLNQAVQLAATEVDLMRSRIWQTIIELYPDDRIDEELRLFESAIETGIQDPELRQWHALERGRSQELKGEIDAAIGAYKQGLAVDGGDPAIRGRLEGLRLMLLPEIARRAGPPGDFERRLEDTFVTAVDCAYCSWILSTNLLATFDRGRSVVLAQKAVRLEPTNQIWQVVLGAAQYRAGSYSNAIRAFLGFEGGREGRRPDNRWVRSLQDFYLAMSYHQLGNAAGEQQAYKEAVVSLNLIKAEYGADVDDVSELEGLREEVAKLLGTTSP